MKVTQQVSHADSQVEQCPAQNNDDRTDNRHKSSANQCRYEWTLPVDDTLCGNIDRGHGSKPAAQHCDDCQRIQQLFDHIHRKSQRLTSSKGIGSVKKFDKSGEQRKKPARS